MFRKTVHSITVALFTLSLLLGGPAQAAPAKSKQPARAEAKEATGASDRVVNINTATEDQLRYLPGIGPSKAQAIVKHRVKAKFTNTAQLMRVKGIGRKTYLKLRPHLTIKGETTLSQKLKLQEKDE